jgi:CelD/BcsL family acetyltransferase involved in cellulose biosynthesis
MAAEPVAESMLEKSRTEGLAIPSETAATAEPLIEVYTTDPLKDPRWKALVESHPQASMFHTTEWLQALQETYGYQPVVYTTSPPGKALQNGLVLCDVNSWLTGQRLVSLPFSDHCEPLVDRQEDFQAILAELCKWVSRTSHQYFELRPVRELTRLPQLIQVSETYGFHQLDLRPDLDSIFNNFHKDSVQRKIKRAEREKVEYREGNELLDPFYRMMVITRRRHKVPPQPKEWFETLMRRMGDAARLRMAFYRGRPIAGMLTVRHKGTFVYKYGCSDARYNNVGGIHLLYWTSIQNAKELGCETFDFGRCDSDQEGLMTFKRRWGAAQTSLQYHRYASHGKVGPTFHPAASGWKMRMAEKVFGYSPAPVLSLIGKFLYKHVG